MNELLESELQYLTQEHKLHLQDYVATLLLLNYEDYHHPNDKFSITPNLVHQEIIEELSSNEYDELIFGMAQGNQIDRDTFRFLYVKHAKALVELYFKGEYEDLRE